MGPDRLSGSSDALVAAAVLGRLKRTGGGPRPGFYVPSRPEEPRSGEQPMKESGGGEGFDGGADDFGGLFNESEVSPDGPAPWRPARTSERRARRGRYLPNYSGLSERSVPEGPSEPRFKLTFGEGGNPLFEVVADDAEAGREKLIEATADYLGTVIGDPLFAAATERWESEAFPETQAAGLIDGASAQLETAFDTPLKGLGAALGLSSGEAAAVAGISSNLILAPITGPLGEAASFIEIAGIVVGLATGAHVLVLACAKPLLHSQVERVLSRSIADLLGGSHLADAKKPTDRVGRTPSQDFARWAMREQEHQTADDATGRRESDDPPRTQRGPGGDEQLWLCLCYVPRQSLFAHTRRVAWPAAGSGVSPRASRRTLNPLNSAETDSSLTETPQARRGPGRPQAVSLADDEFLRALSSQLIRSSVSRVDGRRLREMSKLPAEQHFVLQGQGVGFGTGSAKSDPQASYQHPGCLMGQCVLPGNGRCACPCIVCQRARARARLGNILRGNRNARLSGPPVSGSSRVELRSEISSQCCIRAATSLRCDDRLR